MKRARSTGIAIRDATRLYERVGYVPIDRKPVRDRWRFVDLDGVAHFGIGYVIHMRHRMAKSLRRS
jgi:hypothetical protein